MKSWIIAALAGAILGAAGAYGFLSQRYEGKFRAVLEENEQLKNAAADAKSEVEANRQRLKAAEEMNRQLAKNAQTTEAADHSTEQAAAPAAPERDRAAEMKAFGERMVKRGTDRWKDALNLTPDQLLRLNQLLQAKLQNPQQGNFWNPQALQAELLQVLTPAQKTEYEHIQTRENQARLELRTQTQLSQVQSMFDLTETQKDQIYQKFAALEQAPAATTPAQTQGNQGGQNQGGGRNQGRQAQMQKRVDALTGILTPEQIQQYQKMQGNNNNGFGGPPF